MGRVSAGGFCIGGAAWLLALLFCAFLSGCGDLDEVFDEIEEVVEEAEDEEDDWFDDDTSPRVVSRQPADGASAVELLPYIAVRFSEGMDAATIDTSSFQLTDPAGNPVSGAVDYSFELATFTPDRNLQPYTTYRVTVTTAVRDLAGNSLPDTCSWSFTTGM